MYSSTCSTQINCPLKETLPPREFHEIIGMPRAKTKKKKKKAKNSRWPNSPLGSPTGSVLITPARTSCPASVSQRVTVSAAIFSFPNSAVSHPAVDVSAPERALQPTACLCAAPCSGGSGGRQQHFSNLLFAIQSAAAAAPCARTRLSSVADCDVFPLFLMLLFFLCLFVS